MAKKVGLAMRVPAGTNVSDFDVSGGVAGLASGVTSKLARKAGPKAHAMLQELLGEPLVVPKTGQLLQVSSVEPAKGIVRLHTSTGGRILSTVSDFMTAIMDGVVERAEWVTPAQLGGFDAASQWTGRGERIPKVTTIGPRGGTTTKVTRRPIPPTATR